MTKEFENIKLKILVCEAQSRVLLRLDSWVKAMGNDVYSCDDGIVALDIFQEHRPDIILLSQDLKSMGSLEFIESIQKINPSQAIILMLNENTDLSFFKRSIDLQVDKYLNKPINATPLFNAVEALAKEKLWHEEFRTQKRVLQDYKDAIDLTFNVSKHDMNGDIFYVNNLFCTATELHYSDAMNGVINPLKNPNEDMKKVWNSLQTKHIYRDRQVFKIEDKQDHIMDITAVAILDENSEVSEYLVFSNDVSDVVHAARQIKQQELNSKIQKLEHEKEVSRIKDSFLTVFTHELKTPLNSIINFSQYVKKHLEKQEFTKKETLVQQVSQINISGWEMLDMITNLIDSMQLKDGNISLKPTTFSVSDVLNTTLDKYSEHLADKKIIKSYTDDIELFCDESRMSQILNGLISNAIKYSHLKIAVVLRKDKENFAIEILDDGEGFGDTTKVFELFEQSNEDNMTRTAQGTGVGLYVVKKLCDIMNFRVHLGKSNNLGGARVVITGKLRV